MKKVKQQAKKRVRITEFPDIERGAGTSSSNTSGHLVNQEQPTAAHKRPRTEGDTSFKELDHFNDNNTQVSDSVQVRRPAEGSIPELSADKDVLACVPKPQVSAFSESILGDS